MFPGLVPSAESVSFHIIPHGVFAVKHKTNTRGEISRGIHVTTNHLVKAVINHPVT